MDEESDVKGSKVGMDRKIIAGIMATLILIAGIGFLWWQMSGDGNTTTISVDLYWDYIDMGDVWHLSVIGIQGPPTYVDGLSMHHVEFQIINNTTNLRIENIYMFQIINGSNVHGMQWFDQNFDSIINIGDYLKINKTYSVDGNIDMNEYSLGLGPVNGLINHHPERIYTPPTEFLDMNVVKTTTGWSMTVAWVNESVPEQILKGTSFRLENESGEFFTTHPNINNVIGEWYATVGIGTGDMGYFNITFYDNNNDTLLSVNDCIIIDNTKGLVESGFIFKFINSSYGAVHVVKEIILQ